MERKNEEHIERKSQLQIGTPEGKRRIWASIPAPVSVQTPLKIQQIFDLTHELKEANPKRKRGNESEERGQGDGGSLILFNRAITHSQFCPWIQMS